MPDRGGEEKKESTNLARRPECMPDQLRLVHQLVDAVRAVQRSSYAEVAPDGAAEVYKGDHECDFLVGGHYDCGLFLLLSHIRSKDG